MQTMVPQGREAVSAWRSLTPQARAIAWAAAKQGAAPPDASLGIVSAGYGRTMARRFLVLSIVAPFVMIFVIIGGVVALAIADVPGTPVFIVALPVTYVVVVIAVRLQRRRFLQLNSSGLLAVEAARAGRPIPAPAGWSSSYQSEFTVPYQAFAAPAVPTPVQPPATPVAPPTEPVEVRARPGGAITRLVVLTVFGAYVWLRAVYYTQVAGGNAELGFEVVFFALGVAYTVLIVMVAVPTVRLLMKPVVARFTPDGWELPHSRMAGSWAELREIRVRAPRIGRTGYAVRTPATRIVALVLAYPQPHLERLSPVRRLLLRPAIRRYGSPATIMANARRTMDVVQLVNLLARYTPAPVNWG
jgi:hypothetical protein